MGSPRLLAVWRFVTFGLLIVALFWVPSTAADSVRQISRIRAEVDEHQRIPLAGHIHPRLREAEDRGMAPHDLPMERMLLLLKSSPEQEQELANLLADQQNPSSPNYHRWLTPQQFGERFGPSEQDVQTVANWLRGHGFQVNAVAQGRRAIEFSGTAGQVRSAFRTAIHSYASRGKQHWANAGEPQIPAALGPVIGGIASLHNFKKRPMHRVQGEGAITRGAASEMNISTGGHALSPYDFATIYNVLPLWNAAIDGTGQTIAIPARSEFDPVDLVDFRSRFGLPYNYPTTILNGPSPGLVSGDTTETTLDVSWSGAVAKGATIQLVVSASTNSADGIDLSNSYIVDHNLAPIVSVSYGGCEQDAGGLNQFYASLWQQAAAQGMSVFVSSGDSGSAGCDADTASNASGGFGVNALASTPYAVAVGGTEFAENGNDSSYWNASNDSRLASAKGYIPETTWNETRLTASSNTGLWASGGGISTLYARPSWQTGTGISADDPGAPGQHHRLLPDVSLSAAGHDSYAICLNLSCESGKFHGIAGTSASAPAFAGLMALINQSQGGRQGNPNFRLYPLSTVAGVYHDVTSGSNAVPCSSGSAGCTGSVGGIPAMGGYSAGSGFDLATGWGSVDANALVMHWADVQFTPTTVTTSITPTTFQHGSVSSLHYDVTVAGAGGTPTGSISMYIAKPGGAYQNQGFALQSGHAAGDLSAVLPGGSSTVTVRYSGDGTYGTSSSTTALTVTPEPSSLTLTQLTDATAYNSFQIRVVVAGSSGVGTPTGTVICRQGSTQVATGYLYLGGTYCLITAPAVGQYTYTVDYSGDASFSPSSASITVQVQKATPYTTLSSNGYTVVRGTATVLTVSFVTGGAPTGTVQLYDGASTLGAPLTLVNGTAKYTTGSLAPGTHNLHASYSGDSNFTAKDSSTISISIVTKGTTTVWAMLESNLLGAIAPGSPLNVTIAMTANALGPAPTGTFTIRDASGVIWQGAAAVNSTTATINTPASPLPLGVHNFQVAYSGDSAWEGSTGNASSPVTVSNPDFSIQSDWTAFSVARGSSANVTIRANSIAGLTGTVTFSCSGVPAGATCRFSPSSVPVGSSTTLSISVAASVSAFQPRPRGLPLVHLSAGAFVLGWTMLTGVSRRRRLIPLILLLCLASLLPWTGCGGGGGSGVSSIAAGGAPSTGTPVGTYPITVTATMGEVSHNTTFNLTVY